MRGKRRSIKKDERRCDLMEGYVELTKQYLAGRRNISKKVFKLVGTIFRGINNNRFTFEEVEKELFGREIK